MLDVRCGIVEMAFAKAQVGVQATNLARGPEAGAQQAAREQLLWPLRVIDVTLAARHRVRFPRIRRDNLDPEVLKHFVDRSPVHACGFRRYGRDAIAFNQVPMRCISPVKA